MSAISRRDATIIGAMLGVTILLGILLSLISTRTESPGYRFQSSSSYHRGRTGLKALHDGLKASGYTTVRNRKALTALEGDGTLLVARPVDFFSGAEMNALREWVEQGNRLILAYTILDIYRISAPTITDESDSLTSIDTPEVFEPALPSRIFDGVREIETRWGNRIIDDSWIPLYRPQGFPNDEEETEEPGRVPLIPLVADPKGQVISKVSLGKGDVFLITCPWILSNEGLKQADNLRFVLNIIGPPSEGQTVFFDEYHHGYRDREHESGTLFSYYTWAAFIQLLVGLCLWGWYRSRRFGIPLDPLPKQKVRTEYLDAMAQLLNKASAHTLAYDTLRPYFHRELTQSLGLHNDASYELILQRATIRGVDTHRLKELLDVRQAEQNRSSAAATFKWARTWHSLLQEARTR